MIPGTWSWKKKESNVAQTENTSSYIIVLIFLFFFLRLFTKSQKSRVIEQTFTVFIGLTDLSIILR